MDQVYEGCAALGVEVEVVAVRLTNGSGRKRGGAICTGGLMVSVNCWVAWSPW